MGKGRKSADIPICPTCGAAAKMSAGRWGMKAECCGLWSWNGKDLVGRDTHANRIRAHAAFDQIWKSGKIARGTAYGRLAELMGMTRDECHMSIMTAEQANRVVAIVLSGDLEHATDAAPQERDREIWITVGADRTETGERAIYCFRNVGQAHAAGFAWVR